MTDTDPIIDLIARWEEQRQKGIDLTPQELCPTSPELWPKLAERIRRRRGINAFIDATTPEQSEVGPPTLAGYEILEKLGEGGMGVVWKARQQGLNRLVAIKTIAPGANADPIARTRFESEARAIARLRHPHIVEIYEFGIVDAKPYLVMEFLPGGSLADHIRKSVLPPTEAAGVVESVARAMAHAHRQGIVHRDLKPANILLSEARTAKRPGDPTNRNADAPTLTGQAQDSRFSGPKVADFGLVKLLDDATGPTWTGAVMGTPGYMAPEQAKGSNNEIGPAADIYALGAILYDVLIGRPPFRGATRIETLQQVVNDEPIPPRRLQPGVPRDLETICLKCLQKLPAKRYATAEALADDLRAFRDGRTILARPSSLPEKAIKWARRHPTTAALIAVSILAAIIVLAIILQYNARLISERNQAVQARSRAERNLDLALQTSRSLSKLARVTGNEPSAEGLASLNEAIAAYERLSEEFPDDPQYRVELGLLNHLLNRHDKSEATFKKGVDALRLAVDLREVALETQPNDLGALRSAADAHHQLGDLLAARGMKDEAEQAIQRALELRDRAVSVDPQSRNAKVELAMTQVLRARFELFLREKHALALEWALKALPELIADSYRGADRIPGSLEKRTDAYAACAMALAHLGRDKEAISYWENALADPSLTGSLRRKFEVNRLYLLAKTGEHAKAVESVEALAKQQSFPMGTWVDLAETLSVAAKTVLKDEALPQSQRARLATQYLDRAVAGLLRAEEAGALTNRDDIVFLRTAADLENLRQRPEMQALLGRLAKS